MVLKRDTETADKPSMQIQFGRANVLASIFALVVISFSLFSFQNCSGGGGGGNGASSSSSLSTSDLKGVLDTSYNSTGIQASASFSGAIAKIDGLLVSSDGSAASASMPRVRKLCRSIHFPPIV